MIYLLSDIHGGESMSGIEKYLEICKDTDLLIILGDLSLKFGNSEENREFTRWFLSLKNNIDNFHTYAKFPGTESGKLQHSHIFVDEIYTDRKGNLTGDSIDLSPCDYIINDARIPRDIDLFNEEIEVIDYEQTEIWDLL